jgi:hypothetical protein
MLGLTRGHQDSKSPVGPPQPVLPAENLSPIEDVLNGHTAGDTAQFRPFAKAEYAASSNGTLLKLTIVILVSAKKARC